MEKNLVGEGNYGKVVKVNNIAIKKIPDQSDGVNIIEPYVMLKLKHKNINGAHFVKIGQKSIWIYQDLADKDLFTYLREAKIPDSMMVDWKNQIFRGLEFLHSCGLVHGDIKSSNVLVYGNTLKICDFSLTYYQHSQRIVYNDFSSGTCEKNLCTVTHRPPEVWLSKEFNHKADIWSLGCLLYEMENRSYLFIGSGIDEIKKFFSSKRKDITRTMEMCLRLNPDERPEVCDLLGEGKPFQALKGCVTHESLKDCIRRGIERSINPRIHACVEVFTAKLVSGSTDCDFDTFNEKNLLKRCNFNFII